MKNHIKVRNLLLLIIILILLSTTGCFHIYSKENVIMVSQIFCAVPGASTIDDHAISYKYLDTDDYGRKLFAFAIYTGKGPAGICILQKCDNEYVYYYDNTSYFCTDFIDSYTPELLDDLKAANDWNKILNEDKMIKRPVGDIFHLFPARESSIDYGIVQNAFYNTISEDKKISTYPTFFDYSQTGQEIFFVSRVTGEVTDAGYQVTYIDDYLMILNSDGSYDPENYLVKLEDVKNSNAQLAEIKEKNGWVG